MIGCAKEDIRDADRPELKAIVHHNRSQIEPKSIAGIGVGGWLKAATRVNGMFDYVLVPITYP